MTCKLYVFKEQAYLGKRALRSLANVKPRKAIRLESLDPNPRLVFHVTDQGLDALATDPVDVRFLTAGRPAAEVRVLPVRG